MSDSLLTHPHRRPHTEASELGEVTPGTCSVAFDDPNDLRTFTLTVKPDEGFWKNGTFIFYISVPVEYNIKVRTVSHMTVM